MTNLALALRLDPSIVACLHQVTFMGGTHLGQGNSSSMAEHNILADPEAAHIVLEALAVRGFS